MSAAREPMDEVVRRPRAGELHVTLAHGGAGGSELVLVTLYVLAVDKMGDIENHLAVVHEPAAYFLVERQKETVHLKTDGAGTGLAFAGAGGVFAQAAEIFAPDAIGTEMAIDLAAGAVVHEDLQVHFGLAAQFLNVGKELALIGADGLAQAFIVVKDSTETEGQYRGMLEAVSDDPGVIDARLLCECFLLVVLADDNGEVAGGIEENLVTTYAENGFQRNGFAMTG